VSLTGTSATAVIVVGGWRPFLDGERHVRRRNRIVHNGDHVDRDGAIASVDVISEVFDYVERLVGAVPKPGALWGEMIWA
jgi:hypothetical protein